jgi:sulfur-carrier protein
MSDAPVQLLYFGWVRERAGRAQEALALPEGTRTVGELVAWLRARDGAAGAFAEPARIRAAVNQEFARADAPVRPGDEVAFFPPVTGG